VQGSIHEFFEELTNHYGKKMLHGNFHSCRLAPSEIKVHQNQSFERYPELFTNLTIWGAILQQGMNLKRVNLVFLPFF
jgi:hypothetical protein